MADMKLKLAELQKQKAEAEAALADGGKDAHIDAESILMDKSGVYAYTRSQTFPIHVSVERSMYCLLHSSMLPMSVLMSM